MDERIQSRETDFSRKGWRGAAEIFFPDQQEILFVFLVHGMNNTFQSVHKLFFNEVLKSIF
jgi:hypothetical protein